MSYLAYYTEPNADPVAIGEYPELYDARNACQWHLSAAWDEVHGSYYKALDPQHSYDRGQFAQWDGISRLYVTTPSRETAHYDIVERTW